MNATHLTPFAFYLVRCRIRMRIRINVHIYVKETLGYVGYVEFVQAFLNHVGPQLLKGDVEAVVDVGRLRVLLTAKQSPHTENDQMHEKEEYLSASR